MHTNNLHAHLDEKLSSLNWNEISFQLDHHGFTVLEHVLTEEQCNELTHDYERNSLYRKTVNMQRYNFGLGEYKYYDYPLPHVIQQLRQFVYPYLVPIANSWFNRLNLNRTFPNSLQEFLSQCHAQGQCKATPLILQYQQSGFNTLHQDLYGDVYFPMQMVIFLNQAHVDYQGGEFVLVQQIPRAQSKATVLQPQKGDILIFATRFKAEMGARGYYRSSMKHGVSPLHAGERYTLGIIFHDAEN